MPHTPTALDLALAQHPEAEADSRAVAEAAAEPPPRAMERPLIELRRERPRSHLVKAREPAEV
jgi:hypothetical protein